MGLGPAHVDDWTSINVYAAVGTDELCAWTLGDLESHCVIAAVRDLDSDSVASRAFGSAVFLSCPLECAVDIGDLVAAVGPFGGGDSEVILVWT